MHSVYRNNLHTFEILPFSSKYEARKIGKENVLLDADDDDETRCRIVNNRIQAVVKAPRFLLLTSSDDVVEANVANNETVCG